VGDKTNSIPKVVRKRKGNKTQGVQLQTHFQFIVNTIVKLKHSPTAVLQKKCFHLKMQCYLSNQFFLNFNLLSFKETQLLSHLT
jgi:hypothetical protein